MDDNKTACVCMFCVSIWRMWFQNLSQIHSSLHAHVLCSWKLTMWITILVHRVLGVFVEKIQYATVFCIQFFFVVFYFFISFHFFYFSFPFRTLSSIQTLWKICMKVVHWTRKKFFSGNNLPHCPTICLVHTSSCKHTCHGSLTPESHQDVASCYLQGIGVAHDYKAIQCCAFVRKCN